MEREYCWFLLGICGLLSQLGGTFWKSYRREFIALAMGVAWCVFQGFTWNIFLFIIAQDIAFRLPFTLKGDGVPGNALNWLWLPLWGILICSPVLILNWHVWPATAILGLILALMGALSNIKATARYFQWKFVEFFIGSCPSIVMCYAITL